MSTLAGPPEDDRGVSPVVAVVVLFGLILFAATLVAVTGISLIDAMETEASLDGAETSMQQVQSDLNELANNPDKRRSELSLSDFQGGQATVADDGRITFSINPDRTSNCTATMDVGTLEYERDGGTVGFQAGGVWRSTDGGSTLVSEPDLLYDEIEEGGTTVRTIDFPAVNVDPNASAVDGSSIEARQNRTLSAEQQAKFQEDLCLPASGNESISRVRSIEIRVEGNQYADAWYRYLDSEIGSAGTVQMVGDTVVAKAPLGAPIRPEDFTITDPETFGALHSASSFNPNNLNKILVDGYNSQTAPYDSGSDGYDRATGKIVSSGDLTLTGNNEIWGELRASGSVEDRSNRVADENEYPNEDIEEPPNIDGDIDDTIADIDENDQNGETSVIDAQSLSLSSGESATLESGVYYLDSLEVPQDAHLTLDTSGGDLVIAAPNGVTVESGATVEVTGGAKKQVRIFSNDDIQVDGNVVETADRSYKNFWYAPSGATVTLDGDEFTGVAYAPDADVHLADGLDIYGSLIGNFGDNIREVGFHYDTTLDQLSGDNSMVGNGEVTGPDDPNLESFDARATILGSEFSLFGRQSDITPSRPLETVPNDDDNLGSLSYWQQTSSRVATNDQSFDRIGFSGSLDHASSGDDIGSLSYNEYAESTIDDNDNSRCTSYFLGHCFGHEYYEETTFTGSAGDTVEIEAIPDDAGDGIDLTLYDPDGNPVAGGSSSVGTTLSTDGTYTIRATSSSNDVDYRLELRKLSMNTYLYEEGTFNARNGDSVEISVSTDDASPRVELLDSSGNTLAEGTGSSSVTISESDLDGEQHTIRVSSTDPSTSFDYDISLKRTYIENADLFSHAPIRVDLVTNPPNSSATYHRPWPSPRLDAQGYGDAGWVDDVNHPAVPEVQSEDLEGLEPGTSFSVEMEYRLNTCNPTDSYAGTKKTIDEDEYFEVGCGSNDGVQETIEYVPDTSQNQLKILQDGDEVPDVAPADGQRGMQDMLGSRLNDDNVLELDEDEVVIAFELDTTDADFEDAVDGDSSAGDFNDVVLLYEITELHGDGLTGPDGSPLDPDEDFSYTVNIENNQVVIESE